MPCVTGHNAMIKIIPVVYSYLYDFTVPVDLF